MLPWFSIAALAHGPPAAVLGVASFDAVGPVHVVLSEGLAVRVPDGWQYICPSRWGGLPLAPFAGGSPEAVWLPGLDDVYRVGLDGGAEATGDPAHAVPGLLDLDSTAGVWAIFVGSDGRELVRLDTGLSRIGGPRSWSGILGRETGADLVAAADGALVAGALDYETEAIEETTGFPLVGTGPQLVDDGTTTWVLDPASEYIGLHRLDGAALVAQAVTSLEGPVVLGGQPIAALDGLLFFLTEGGPVRTAEDNVVGCLVSGGDRRWACSRDLYELTEQGLLGELVLPLDELAAPSLEGLSSAAGVDCWGEWRTYAFDVGIEAGDMPVSATPAVIVANGTCATGGDRLGLLPLLAAWMLRFPRPSRTRRLSR